MHNVVEYIIISINIIIIVIILLYCVPIMVRNVVEYVVIIVIVIVIVILCAWSFSFGGDPQCCGVCHHHRGCYCHNHYVHGHSV